MDCNPPGSSVMGFARQEYRSGLLCPPPGDLSLATERIRLHLPLCRVCSFTQRGVSINPGSLTLDSDSNLHAILSRESSCPLSSGLEMLGASDLTQLFVVNLPSTPPGAGSSQGLGAGFLSSSCVSPAHWDPCREEGGCRRLSGPHPSWRNSPGRPWTGCSVSKP